MAILGQNRLSHNRHAVVWCCGVGCYGLGVCSYVRGQVMLVIELRTTYRAIAIYPFKALYPFCDKVIMAKVSFNAVRCGKSYLVRIVITCLDSATC